MKKLTNEEMKLIYTNKKLRNNVANAHGCCNSNMEFLHKKAFWIYPQERIVTEEQIAEAKEEIKRSCAETLENNKGKLLLVGMGWAGADVNTNDVGNCRVRGYFMNGKGVKCFVEANHHNNRNTGGRDLLWFDFAHYCDKYDMAGHQHHLLSNVEGAEYTKANILRYVNSAFETDFKELVIDNYDLAPDSFVSAES
jgi:hypothetical protein